MSLKLQPPFSAASKSNSNVSGSHQSVPASNSQYQFDASQTSTTALSQYDRQLQQQKEQERQLLVSKAIDLLPDGVTPDVSADPYPINFTYAILCLSVKK